MNITNPASAKLELQIRAALLAKHAWTLRKISKIYRALGLIMAE
jgi:hypothetical protein